MDFTDKKRRDLEFGLWAEKLASEYYTSQGYAILERNWTVEGKSKIEIDIIARTGNIVAFVEVKARRGDAEDPVAAVGKDKMRRMARGADIYLKTLCGDVEYRYDIFAVTGTQTDYKVEVIQDAFLSPLM